MKLSLGGKTNSIPGLPFRRPAAGKLEVAAYSQLKEELVRMVKANQTRQARLNEMEIGKNETESRYAALLVKCQELRKERDDALKAANESKKKIRHLEAALRRSRDKEEANDKTISTLLTRLGTEGPNTLKSSYKRRPIESKERDDANRKTNGEAGSTATASASTLKRAGSGMTEKDENSFDSSDCKDAEEVGFFIIHSSL